MGTFRDTVRAHVDRYNSVSTHSLALWRVGVGVVAGGNTIYQWRHADVFFMSTGVYPSELLSPLAGSPLSLIESPLGIHAFFLVSVIACVLYAAGVRGVKFVLPFLLASIHQRNPLLATAGNTVMMLALMYSWLLPIEHSWSYEHYHRTGRIGGEAKIARSWGYALVLLQLAVNYAFNMINKLTPIWESGGAVERSLGNASAVTPFMGFLFDLLPESLFVIGNYGTLVVEGALPFLLLTPIYRRQAHLMAAALMLMLHGMIFFTLEVGMFGPIMLAQIGVLILRPRPEQQAKMSVLTPRPWVIRLRGAFAWFLFYLMAYSLGRHENTAGINRGKFDFDLVPLPRQGLQVLNWLNLHQGWGMFHSPTDRSFVTVTHAETDQGTVFDPWRFRAADEKELLTKLPRAAYPRHFYFNFDGRLVSYEQLRVGFAPWVFRQSPPGKPNEKVVRFASWSLTVPAEKEYVEPLNVIYDKSGHRRLPLAGVLPLKSSSFGVWAPQRATDGMFVDDGSHVLNPTGSVFSPGCAHFVFELPQPTDVRSAFLQTDAIDVFLLEASKDGKTYFPLAETQRIRGRQYRSQLVHFEADDVRFVRLRPKVARHRRGYLSEFALFSTTQEMPAIPLQEESHFMANYDAPGALGFMNSTASGKCPWDSDLKDAPSGSASR